MRSNTVHWNAEDQQKVLEQFLADQFPLKLFHSTLHEAVHYWCANSPVGRAIHLLWLECLAEVLRDPLSNGVVFHGGTVEFFARIGAIENCLRPVAEGLAMFGEFDVCYEPGKLRHWSFLTGLSLALSSESLPTRARALQDAREKARELSNFLHSVKLEQEVHLRKSNLFCHPLRPDHVEDAYLLGYLLVRQLYARTADEARGPLHPDLFLRFLRAYIYEDWSLVSLLLDHENACTSSAVLAHLFRRLRALSQTSISERINQYETAIRRGDSSSRFTWESLPGMDLTPEQIHQGDSDYRRSLDRSAMSSRSQFGEALVRLTSYEHSILTLFDGEVHIHIDSDGTARVRDLTMTRVLATFPSARRVIPSSGKGRFIVYLTDQAHPPLLLKSLMLNDELVGIWTNRPWDSRIASVFEESLELEMMLVREFQSFFRSSLLLSEEVPSLMIEKQIEAASRSAALVYRDFVKDLTKFSQQILAAVPEATGNLGLRSLFHTGEDLDAYSLVSLCNSWTTERNEIQSALINHGYDLGKTINQIDDIRLQTGISLLAKNTANIIETSL